MSSFTYFLLLRLKFPIYIVWHVLATFVVNSSPVTLDSFYLLLLWDALLLLCEKANSYDVFAHI